MVMRKSGSPGNWTDGHRRVLLGGRHVFRPRRDWALGGVSSRLDSLEPTYTVPSSILPSIRQAWADMRHEIMADWNIPGRKPWAWWILVSPEPRDLAVSEPGQLHRLGEISDAEFAAEDVQLDHLNYHLREQ